MPIKTLLAVVGGIVVVIVFKNYISLIVSLIPTVPGLTIRR